MKESLPELKVFNPKHTLQSIMKYKALKAPESILGDREKYCFLITHHTCHYLELSLGRHRKKHRSQRNDIIQTKFPLDVSWERR